MNAMPLLVCACVLIYTTCAADETCDNVNTAGVCKCFSDKAWKITIDCNSRYYYDSLNFTESNVTTLELINARLDLTSRRLFTKLKLKKLILHSVTAHFLHLQWYPEILSAANETLRALEVYNSKFVFAWNIGHPGPMTLLTHLVIVNSPLFYIYSSVGDYTSLEHIELRNDNLQALRDDEFSKLYNLRLLSLSRNNLKEIERKMFPERATYLWHLDFSHNKLAKLPSNIFDEMEQLKEVRLDHNELSTLNEGIFLPVGRNLKELWIHDNKLDCKSELKWMKKHHFSIYTFVAQCRTKTKVIFD